MGNKVDILNEIYTRLNTAQGAGLDLVTVKRIQIGSREECRKLNDYPVINITLESGEETYHSQPHTKTDKIKIQITLICNPLTGENGLYNTSGSLGSLYLFEKMLNVIDKTTAGAIDPGFSNYGDNIPAYTWSIEYIDQLIEYVLTLEVEAKQFMAGSR